MICEIEEFAVVVAAVVEIMIVEGKINFENLILDSPC
jgi:hypothetical protein